MFFLLHSFSRIVLRNVPNMTIRKEIRTHCHVWPKNSSYVARECVSDKKPSPNYPEKFNPRDNPSLPLVLYRPFLYPCVVCPCVRFLRDKKVHVRPRKPPRSDRLNDARGDGRPGALSHPSQNLQLEGAIIALCRVCGVIGLCYDLWWWYFVCPGPGHGPSRTRAPAVIIIPYAGFSPSTYILYTHTVWYSTYILHTHTVYYSTYILHTHTVWYNTYILHTHTVWYTNSAHTHSVVH